MTQTALPAGGPLTGLRVVELGALLAGPFTGRLLGLLRSDDRRAREAQTNNKANYDCFTQPSS